MMIRNSPPKHRHDGTSPLPLGMDWSPPPRNWNGRDTVWPHDPHTGWSYCVTIPTWVVRPKSRNADPVVFYRVQVGLQSPEGITTTQVVFRRFNDFLKLLTELKKAFPKKNLPTAPPKGLLRLKSRALLDERRCSLEEWLTKLLSDIDVSRSVVVASFLELEVVARSSFQDIKQPVAEPNASGDSSTSSLELHPSSSLSVLAGSSLASDYGSDTAYEISELGTPRASGDFNYEVGLEDLGEDEDLTNPIEKLVKYGMSNIDEGLFMGETLLEQLESFPKHKAHSREVNHTVGRNIENGNSSKEASTGHTRKLSTESAGSAASSFRGSEMSNTGSQTLVGNGFLDLPRSAEGSGISEVLSNNDAQLILPFDQRNKLNKVLMTMHRRLVTAKTDMEDLISRLNQEIAVKDYLTTKVKDLEVELETTRQKSKENLHQALLIERERYTQMKWDMEELRRKSLEMEMKLKTQQEQKACTKSTDVFDAEEKDAILKELNASKEQYENLLKRHEELEAKSKADVKLLVKEVKSLRSSQKELKREHYLSLEEKSEAERLLLLQKQMSAHAKSHTRKLLHECEALHNRLEECNINLLNVKGDKFTIKSSSLSDALDLLTTSNNQINTLIAEAELLAQHKEGGTFEHDDVSDEDNGMMETSCQLRKLLTDILIENAKLRTQVNSVVQCALKSDSITFETN